MALPSPCYVVEEQLLRRNLARIKDLSERAHVEFILAFKAFALWKTFPIFREYIAHTTASSPYEARLALEEFGFKAHTYSPAYEDETFDDILRCSSHISFNSLTQFAHFYPKVQARDERISCGLRINPERSEISTEIYNPCAPGSRFGVTAEQLPPHLPDGIEGFHCHCHCESNSYALERTLQQIEKKFGPWLPGLKWLNLGGGHLVTHKDYDTDHFVNLLTDFQERHPDLRLLLEPGSAFAWQTGYLKAKVIDIVVNNGIKTALLNVSFTCHMPDCLEMPYWPDVRGAETLKAPEATEHTKTAQNVYRLGGNSCLSGDWMGYWRFPKPLHIGDDIIFEDMIHYTTVKTCMFNGIHHPALVLHCADGTDKLLRQYKYEDYRDRMD